MWADDSATTDVGELSCMSEGIGMEECSLVYPPPVDNDNCHSQRMSESAQLVYSWPLCDRHVP